MVAYGKCKCGLTPEVSILETHVAFPFDQILNYINLFVVFFV